VNFALKYQNDILKQKILRIIISNDNLNSNFIFK